MLWVTLKQVLILKASEVAEGLAATHSGAAAIQKAWRMCRARGNWSAALERGRAQARQHEVAHAGPDLGPLVRLLRTQETHMSALRAEVASQSRALVGVRAELVALTKESRTRTPQPTRSPRHTNSPRTAGNTSAPGAGARVGGTGDGPGVRREPSRKKGRSPRAGASSSEITM